MKRRSLAAIVAVTALSACSTNDFSTPVVNLQHRLVANSSTVCTPSTSGETIDQPSVDNARSLIHNFILVYRCRSREAANGRQAFQIPAFLAVVGATAATAFGAGQDVAIAGTVGSSIFNAGNSYYSPLQQAGIYNSAIDALVCIQSEAVGVEAFVRPEDDERDSLDNDERGGGEGDSAVYTTAEVQYYEMVRAALFNVELVAARRLMNIAPVDPAGVVAEITALNREAAENLPPGREDDGGADDQAGVEDEEGGGARDEAETVRLAIAALQPRLQRCVVRAKI